MGTNMDTQYRKTIGNAWELLVQNVYEQKWYHCKDKNFTIRGGELDLVMEDDNTLVVVEVKVVNYMDNLHNYITPKKLITLQKSIQIYLWKYPTNKPVRLDIVFVKGNEIVQTYENVEI